MWANKKFNTLRTLLHVLIFIGFSTKSNCQSEELDSMKVFYLGGQSNMDGYGFNKDLPDSLIESIHNVWIFHGNPTGDGQIDGGLGKWEKLRAGHGVGFKSDGSNNFLSDRFGVEISLAKRLCKLYPHEKIGLIKYSKGGTSLDSLAARNYGSWEADFKGLNGINQFDHFLTTVKKAMYSKDIDGNGKNDYLIPKGIIWMQGESDAFQEKTALSYYANLKKLMNLMRAAFHENSLPIVLGKISDSWNDIDGKVYDYGDLIQYSQEKYAKTDNYASIVRSTRYYKYSDKWHYDSKAYIDLGEKFAEAI